MEKRASGLYLHYKVHPEIMLQSLNTINIPEPIQSYARRYYNDKETNDPHTILDQLHPTSRVLILVG